MFVLQDMDAVVGVTSNIATSVISGTLEVSACRQVIRAANASDDDKNSNGVSRSPVGETTCHNPIVPIPIRVMKPVSNAGLRTTRVRIVFMDND